MCGEQSRLELRTRFVLGSPPRVRGTAAVAEAAGQLGRITPACAGNSITSIDGSTPTSDHPRVCGEQMDGETVPIDAKGSPPRVRGTEKQIEDLLAANRITPACAGNSFSDVMESINK